MKFFVITIRRIRLVLRAAITQRIEETDVFLIKTKIFINALKRVKKMDWETRKKSLIIGLYQ